MSVWTAQARGCSFFSVSVFKVTFADGFPIMLLSTASVHDLEKRVQQDLGMDRFRPNIVVTGCPPYDEARHM